MGKEIHAVAHTIGSLPSYIACILTLWLRMSAKPATTKGVWAILSHAPDAASSYSVLDASGGSIMGGIHHGVDS